MPDEWKLAIERWRRLPEEEKHRIRWQRIPRSVAQSMAFAGEPVDLATLEDRHARVTMPGSEFENDRESLITRGERGGRT